MVTPADQVQLLTPEGELREHPDYPLTISAEELRGLYRDMVIVRRFDAEATSLQRQGELGLWAPLLGQEAAQVGSGRALEESDFAFPTYREHGVAWTRDVEPASLLGMFRGINNGGWDPEEHRFGLYTIVIGSQTLHATGYAMGIQRDDAKAAVIAYHGDGATSQGDVNEAYVFASVFSAPVVFFCQNNQWAISTSTEHQTRVPLYKRASGFGMPGIRVDGNDVLACLAVTKDALRRAREGEGPTFIEAYTYRMGAHTTSDDPTRYRMGAEVEQWKLRDPIERLKAYLARTGQADLAYFNQIDEEGQEIATKLRQQVLSMEEPPPEALFEHVYAAPHRLIEEEKREYLEYLSSFEGGHH
jgi:2-oxoisovalerate dehydrogenase E1 component alpha subunit